MYDFNASGRTQKGARLLGTDANEDTLVVMPSHGMFMVVDGVSGAPSGDLAAQVTAQAFAGVSSPMPPDRERLEGVWPRANAAIEAIRLRNGPDTRSPLAAASALWVKRDKKRVKGLALQSGETTLVVYDPATHQVIHRSTPLVDGRVPTHLFGGTDKPPVITPIDVPTNCVAILATDGITKTVKEVDLVSMLHFGKTPQDIVDSLLRLAQLRGESDDMTVVVVHL